MLYQPTTLSCSDLTLDGFIRRKAEKVPVDCDQKQPEVSERVTRSKRKHGSVIATRKRKLDWALQAGIEGQPSYVGGAAFLTAHTALLELDLTTFLVPINALTAVFRDSTARSRSWTSPACQTKARG